MNVNYTERDDLKELGQVNLEYALECRKIMEHISTTKRN